MATLSRPKYATGIASPPLESQIPSPFPRAQLAQLTADQEEPELEDHEPLFPPGLEAGSSNVVESTSEPPTTIALKELMPSIVYVQKSCLMTLNDLLSEPNEWHPIVPDRRHSMPSSMQPSTSTTEDSSSTSALHTLVSNLRSHDIDGEMIEAREDGTDADLLRELHVRVESISSSLSVGDAALTKALVSLLNDLNRLSDIHANMAHRPNQILPEETASILEAPPPINMFDHLSRQLSDLQIERLSSQAGILAPGASPLVAVEAALLWSRIDADLENVVAMCKQRAETLPKFTHDNHPPQYDMSDFDDLETLPDYEQGGRASFDDTKSKVGLSSPHQSPRQIDEKMRLDLEGVAMAIDRLYLVAPQLHNQRVELKSSKLAELEKARREGVDGNKSKRATAKGKEKDIRDLENLFEMLGRASERTMKNQSVILDGDMQSRLEKARQKESAKRDAFVEQLVRHSEAGRIHGQDAVLQFKDPEAMLTLPEFMRERVPESERRKDAEAMLTLPEFVKEPPPDQISELDVDIPDETPTAKAKKRRHRSLSAPPLAWLRSSSRNANTSSHHSSSSVSKGKAKDLGQGFDIIYVAENHENLHHILVFFTTTGGKAGAEVQAEIMPPFLNHPTDGGDHLVIKSGPYSSLPLMLPAHTTPGKQDVRAQRGHYEIKLTTQPPSDSQDMENGATALLDATQLLSLKPTSFICASCSLPLIHSTKVEAYRDLPSEHWEELVEAWMCHSDQKLHDHVQKHGKGGFWPSVGQALVGGSYILFETSAMNKTNLYLAEDLKHDDNWRLVRCLCGAIIGRCQEKEIEAGLTTVYRVLKYAVRPISPTVEPRKVPLSAFIVEDMMEFVQAHASYRFVIRDEENEKPRMLIWLFKPKIRLAYTTPSSRTIPKSANILAAKVLYKILSPTEGATDIKNILNKYPGFPQAVYLSYPMSVCRLVAGLLKESNSAYPESLRKMTGLEVGWLQRI